MASIIENSKTSIVLFLVFMTTIVTAQTKTVKDSIEREEFLKLSYYFANKDWCADENNSNW